MSKFKIILVNLLIFLVAFFSIDYIVYKQQDKIYNLHIGYFQNLTKKIAVSEEYDKTYIEKRIQFRPALNGHNTEKRSIVLTGCSFVYGQYLNEDEIFSYKIAQLVENPVYNLGVISKAINTTIALLQYGAFEKEVKVEPSIVIYTYANFHLLRLIMPNMPFEDNEFMFKINDNKLERKRPPFIVSRFISLSVLRSKLYEFTKRHSKIYREHLKKLLKLHFLEMKKLIDSKYSDVKFIVVVYYPCKIFEEIASELEKENIEIIRITEEEFGLDVQDKKNLLPDGHPNALAWEIITPKLVEKIKHYL